MWLVPDCSRKVEVGIRQCYGKYQRMSDIYHVYTWYISCIYIYIYIVCSITFTWSLTCWHWTFCIVIYLIYVCHILSIWLGQVYHFSLSSWALIILHIIFHICSNFAHHFILFILFILFCIFIQILLYVFCTSSLIITYSS